MRKLKKNYNEIVCMQHLFCFVILFYLNHVKSVIILKNSQNKSKQVSYHIRVQMCTLFSSNLLFSAKSVRNIYAITNVHALFV